MELLAASTYLASILNILYTGLGLGFVIFVHELGHFAVAKWCGVRVERFSIGFGPVIWSFIKGETEYALSIIPFGGYVKMLGQDDIDPNEMASENVAKDPRSYTSKTVPQRMAIISAGVIMNMITGTMMFCTAFMMGLESVPSKVGGTSPGSPAWSAGIQPGDEITEIDGYKIVTFSDIMRRVTLSWEKVDLRGVHHDGTEYHEIIVPFKSKDDFRSAIGVLQPYSLTLNRDATNTFLPVAPGTTAAASGEFMGGDTVQEVNGTKVNDHFEFTKQMEQLRDKAVEVTVLRPSNTARHAPADETPNLVTIKVEPNPVWSLGLRMDIGQISAIRKGSPADGQLQIGDRITHVETSKGKQAIGTDLDPLKLPKIIGELYGQKVTLHVKRERPDADPETKEFTVVPENRPGWSESPFDDDSPMSIPSIGVACHVLHTVLSVDAGSAADGVVKPKDQIKSATLTLPENVKNDKGGTKPIEIDFSKKRGWPYLFRAIQDCPLRTVKLKVASAGTEREVELKPKAAKNWNAIDRGFLFEVQVNFHRDDNIATAAGRSIAEARNFVGEIYLILYNLFTGRLSLFQMHGPIGIVGAAVKVSNQGFAPLLFFLAYLSINLAVLNFLPIPVLDGGHMVFLMYEGATGRPPNERVFMVLSYIGLAMLLMLMVTVLGMDILRAFGVL
ncbi:MAG: peptidase [Planctomycetaceae bacterium]|nr:peptidase [Planctomycetaceae bacterium]